MTLMLIHFISILMRIEYRVYELQYYLINSKYIFFFIDILLKLRGVLMSSISKTILLILILSYASAFLVGVDFNTYSAAQLNQAIKFFGHVDFTWAITVNSPGVTPQLWKDAFSATNNHMVFSQDNPMQFKQCSLVRQYSGTLTAAFGYHQTGGTPATQLNAAEINEYSNNCGGAGVVILTRAYWPNSEWRTNTDKVLSHPKLYGVAMEFNPDDFGKRSQVDFVHNILAAGKTAFFLLPFRNKAGDPTQRQITQFIQYLKANNVNMSENRVRFVLARYDKPYIPITGSTNSIYSALTAAQKLK